MKETGFSYDGTRRSVRVLLAGLSFCAVTAFTHDDPDARVPSLRALKVDAPLNVDGVLDEPFWQEADIATGFIDERTRKPPVDRTDVRIAYTKTHVYVGVECFDEKIEEIRATERRDDRFFRGDDSFEVQFDPFHNHRSKYVFVVNPLGTHYDGKSGASGFGSFNIGWSAEWDVVTKILEDRWVVEMRIPLSVMNYYRRDGQTWGLNFTRVTRRTDSRSFWSFNPTDFFDPRHFGHLTGLDLADSIFDRNWEISPYVSSRFDFDGESDLTSETGVDVSFRLSPSITTAWAINPDFGQVEADADTIELRDTERFLPEKRPFFREGEELFRMRHRLYYSRRFTDIQTAAKISGKMGDYNFNVLNIQGDTTHDETRHGNSTVLRAMQEVGEKSTLGYFLNASEFDDGHSRVASMDGNLFLTDDYELRFQTSIADDLMEDEYGTISKDSLDYIGYVSVDYEKYPWDVSLGYKAITDEFDPTLGYIPRRDIFGPSFRARYMHESDEAWYKRLGAGVSAELYENEDATTILRDYSYYSHVTFPNDLGFFFHREENFHAPYDNHRTRGGVSIYESDFWRSAEFIWARGRFEEKTYDELTLLKRLNLFDRLPIRHELVTRFEEENGEDRTVWFNSIVFDYFFTDDMWVKTALQHQNDEVHNISVIYGWEFMHNAHWYLVYNSVNDGDETERSVFTKIVYTF